ncbi:MAG: T9SS type A sorting domain-containing protein [Chitinophagaceae bacterium]
MIITLLLRGGMLSCLFLTNFIFAQAPVFNGATPNSTTIPKFEKFEVDIQLTAGYANAYDYDNITVQATITAPGGRVDVVDGFFMQDYTIGANGFASPVGNGSFRVRYAPNEIGAYSYVLSCTNLSGTATMPAQAFQCVSSEAHGFIRKNTTNYLSFDDNTQYIPIGENMGWQSNNVVVNYTNWVTDLANNGGNFIRVWMSSWAFALEWKNGDNGFSGLKRYKQSSAFYLDWLLDYCRQKDVYMMLALNNHGQVSSNVNPEWNNNPYNAVNGGPATNTWDFFTDATAKSLHKNRLRYIIARYGYSKNIQSWELFNELHWTNNFEAHKNEITTWDDEMSTYIKDKDVYKHLVTTSYGGTEITTNSWNLPNIDFTQTHFYVNSPNIETVLAAANQSFLSQYSKPTLNGEFGLGPAGAALSVSDPDGVHIHNAIWGSMFSGGLGSAMTWWWDDYIEPRNLYYHYKPLASVVSLIDFRNGNYRKAAASSQGGGGADAIISPGADWGKPPASDFTIDATGNITPAATSLSKYLYGNQFNTANRNPPTFNVNYPVAGQFKVVTGSQTGTSPKINIYVDGVQLLEQNAAVNATYTVNIPAGIHVIKCDNLGTDWILISNFTFTGVGSPLSIYVLKSDNSFKAAGYALNKNYNWQYLNNNGGTPPPAISGCSITVPAMQNGTYNVKLYSPSTGTILSELSISVTTGSLIIPMPSISWDVAFTAVELASLPIRLVSFTGKKEKHANYLYLHIATAEHVKTVFMERSSNANDFSTLQPISNSWASIAGKHQFIDETPGTGPNFYRLKIVDNDGRISYSGIVKLVNNATSFSVYPNPFNDFIMLQIDQGKYRVQVTDQNGRAVYTHLVNAVNNQAVTIPLNNLPKGVYYVNVFNHAGTIAGYMKIMK